MLRDDNSYEDPLKRIFNLFLGMDPLTQIFVDLLPPSFAQRLFVSARLPQR